MESVLFWLAIPLGFFGLPANILGFALVPFAVFSLFTESFAPRNVLLALFGVNLITSLPPFSIICQRVWKYLDKSEENPRHAMMLGTQLLSAALSVAYLTSNGWIGTLQSKWLLTAYWFICLTQVWGAVFIVLTGWLARYRADDLQRMSALRLRQKDTWLTCLKFLIPLYAFHYGVKRETVTPLITFALFSTAIGALSYATADGYSFREKIADAFATSAILVYIMSPVTMGTGAMMAKKYASFRIK